MINVLNVSPRGKLKGRENFSVHFIDKYDIKGNKILDIGCGYGWMELALKKNEAKVVCGIEYQEKDLKTAKKYINEKEISFSVGSAINIPFDKESFDTVISWEVLEHIPKGTEKKMFSEINRVLKNEGVAYISTPYWSWPSVLLDPAWWLIGHRHYSLYKLTQFALSNGFVMEKIAIKGRFWSLMSILNMYTSKWILKHNSMFTKFLENKDNLEYMKDDGYDNIFIKIRKK